MACASASRIGSLVITTSTIVTDVCVWPRDGKCTTSLPAAASAAAYVPLFVAQRVELAVTMSARGSLLRSSAAAKPSISTARSR